MDTCISIEQFKNNLFKTINECGLSIGAAFFVMKDVYNVLAQSYQEALKSELERVKAGTQQKEETLLIPINPPQEDLISEEGENNYENDKL